MTVPPSSEPGTWTIEFLYLVDCLGNSRWRRAADLAPDGFPTSFQVMTSAGDTTPPVLSALTLSPSAVDVSSGAKIVTVIATITDDLVGVAAGTQCPGYNSSPVQIRFRSPSGNQIQTGMAVPSGEAVYSFQVPVPRYSESGTWTIDYLLARRLPGEHPVATCRRSDS